MYAPTLRCLERFSIMSAFTLRDQEPTVTRVGTLRLNLCVSVHAYKYIPTHHTMICHFPIYILPYLPIYNVQLMR